MVNMWADETPIHAGISSKRGQRDGFCPDSALWIRLEAVRWQVFRLATTQRIAPTRVLALEIRQDRLDTPRARDHLSMRRH